ncbi:MAG: tyrosine-type recombinase/integrase [Chloroflexi bacterium]|nr:tyrosine-type recombinase/integrase [Chloroflexota bacterium]
MPSSSLQQAAERYLSLVSDSRSANTHRTYAQAIAKFLKMLEKRGINPATAAVAALTVDTAGWYVTLLKPYAPATEALFLTALLGFYEYLVAEENSAINLTQIKSMLKRRQRKTTPRLPQFPREQIELVMDYVNQKAASPAEDERAHLRGLRDRAFVFTLADTGLRISEACRLTRGHIDWTESRAIVTIKGGRESVVRFSARALAAIKTYLSARAQLDGATGRSLASLPIFSRHDDGAGSKVLRLNTIGARQIVNRAVVGALGREAKGTITPHSFRHYFVTIVLRSSGGNLKLAQELARHKNIAITQRYAHLSDDDLDKGYHEIFNE